MEHFLTALSLQKSGRGVKGTSAVMSDNIWSSVRTAISKMDRGDLYDLCDKKDLDAFKSEFHVDVWPMITMRTIGNKFLKIAISQ